MLNCFQNFLSKRIQLQIPYWIFLLLPFILYLCWETYWFQKVGLRVLKWHTHVIEFGYVWIPVAIAFFYFNREGWSEKAKKIFLLFSSTIFALALLEITLQITGLYKTYVEKVLGDYSSPYSPPELDYYHHWPIYEKEHRLTKPEFSFWRPTNSLGFGDMEWNKKKTPNQKRILSLGDSFTEGDGAPYDSTYVALLQQKMNANGSNCYFMNAGVCGSDPCNNYIFLKNRLLIYKPDVILQVFGTNDLNTDIIFRGGLERFQKNGTQKFTDPPWWEPLYAISYISRIFFSKAGYNELLHKNTFNVEETIKLNNQFIALLDEYIALCDQNNISLILVIRPDKEEIHSNTYQYNYNTILNYLKTKKQVKVFDLLPAYRTYIAKTKTQVADYFWKEDGHHNAKGYYMMAECLFSFLNTPPMDSLFVSPQTKL